MTVLCQSIVTAYYTIFKTLPVTLNDLCCELERINKWTDILYICGKAVHRWKVPARIVALWSSSRSNIGSSLFPRIAAVAYISLSMRVRSKAFWGRESISIDTHRAGDIIVKVVSTHSHATLCWKIRTSLEYSFEFSSVQRYFTYWEVRMRRYLYK